MTTDERAIGQLEGRISAMEDRMERLETQTSKDLSILQGKLDALSTQLAGMATQLAGHKATSDIWRWLVPVMAGSLPAWAMLLTAWVSGKH